MAFLSTSVTYFLMRFCLFLEWTGLCQGAWVVAMIQRKIVKYQRDEVYIGTAEERAAKGHADEQDAASVEAGHMYPGVPQLPPDFGVRHRNLEEINELETELQNHLRETELRLKEVQAQKRINFSKSRHSLWKWKRNKHRSQCNRCQFVL